MASAATEHHADDHAHDDHGHGLAHVATIKTLIATGGTLLILTIVTVLADYGTRYQSKLFDPAFLKAKNLPVPEWLVAPPPALPKMFVASDKT